MHLFFSLILAVLVFVLLRQWQQATPEQRRRGLFYGVVSAVALVSLMLVVTGRIHLVGGMVLALLPWVRRSLMLRRLWQWISGGSAAAGGNAKGGATDNRGTQAMTVAEARELLGVTAQSSREEIVLAHRRLMQQVHPDRGGDTAMAAKANEAKALLLGK